MRTVKRAIRWGAGTALLLLTACRSSNANSTRVAAARVEARPDGPAASQPFESRPWDRESANVLANVAQHTFTTEGRDFDPDLSPDGRMLAFASTRNAERADVFVKSIHGTALVQLTNDPADDVQPRFSPDGERFAFASNRSGDWDIWVAQTDGMGVTRLTRDTADEVAPSWSPDGRRLAYMRWSVRTRQWEIWTLSADEPGVQQFLVHGMFPAWSPDGQSIAFQRARQRGTRTFSVWTVKIVDGEARYPTEVAHHPGAAAVAPRWSRDGQWIAYCVVNEASATPQTGGSEIWVRHVDGEFPHRVTDAGAAAFNPAWGPTGRIYFVSSRSGVENIWSIRHEPPAGAEAGPAEPPMESGMPPEDVDAEAAAYGT